VLGDGAEWIWNQAEDHWPQADGVLDIFHAIERIEEAVKGVWGHDPLASTHADAGRRVVVAEGRRGLERWYQEVVPLAPPGASLDPLIGMAAYFAKHPTRLNYADRLATGRSIGSGAVEGAIKHNVNLRLKRKGHPPSIRLREVAATGFVETAIRTVRDLDRHTRCVIPTSPRLGFVLGIGCQLVDLLDELLHGDGINHDGAVAVLAGLACQ
jgi:hypothetical protein